MRFVKSALEWNEIIFLKERLKERRFEQEVRQILRIRFIRKGRGWLIFLSLSLKLSLSLSHTHTHTHKLCHLQAESVELHGVISCNLTYSNFISLSLSRTHYFSLSPLSHTHYLSLSLTLSRSCFTILFVHSFFLASRLSLLFSLFQ